MRRWWSSIAEFHVAAVIDPVGRHLGQASFDTTPAGSKALLAWANAFGPLTLAGAEGTGAYGAGLARFLTVEHVTVVDVDRPDRKTRRDQGKSDPIDAYAAARVAASGRASGTPKTRTGDVESVRVLRVARTGAIRRMSKGVDPAQVPDRDRPRHATPTTRRPGGPPARHDLRPPATSPRRHRHRSRSGPRDRAGSPTRPQRPSARWPPSRGGSRPSKLRSPSSTTTSPASSSSPQETPPSASPAKPLSRVSAASRPSLPRPARHRTTTASTEAGTETPTSPSTASCCAGSAGTPSPRVYVERRTSEGKSKKDIIRCLKRYIAREVYTAIQTDLSPATTP